MKALHQIRTTRMNNDMIHIYDKYQVNYPYIKEDRFHYEGKLYEVIQAHTSLENWKPNELPALYKVNAETISWNRKGKTNRLT